jgi:hypothetical protein
MRYKLLFYVSFCIISLSSCSAISPVTYYSPQKQEGFSIQFSKSNYPKQLNGPESIAVFMTPKLDISIESFPLPKAPVLIGPSVLSIIPLYPLSLLINGMYPDNPIDILIRFKKKSSNPIEVKWHIHEIKLLLSDGSEILAEDCSGIGVCQDYINFKMPLTNPNDAFYAFNDIVYKYHLHYNVNVLMVDSFHIAPSGLTVDGEVVSLPEIEYRRADGYVYFLIP